MKRLNLFAISVFCLTLLLLSGCAGGELILDSSPNAAEVRAMTGNGYVLLGKSPMRMKRPELLSRLKGDGPVTLEIVKEGYVNKNILLSEIPYGFDVDIKVKLDNIQVEGVGDAVAKDKASQFITFNKMVDRLFEAQRLVNVGRKSDSLKILEEIQAEVPQMAAVYEMQEGIYFMDRAFDKALDSYVKAVRLNPENLEAIQMKRYLEDVVAKRGTASNLDSQKNKGN